MKKVLNTHFTDPFSGEPGNFTIATPDGRIVEQSPMTMAVILRMVVGSFRGGQSRDSGWPAMTMEDSYHGHRVLDALTPFKKIEEWKAGKAPSHIVFEDEDFKWILGATKTRAVGIFNIMADPLVKALELAEKSYEGKKDAPTPAPEPAKAAA